MNIYVTRKLPGREFSNLIKEHNVVVHQGNTAPSSAEIIKNIKGKDGIITLLTDKITKEIIEAGLPTLKIIANCAAGYDNIDVEYATKKGIMVTNTPDVLTDATSELTWALILCLARRIIEADKYTKEGKFVGWSPDLFLGQELSNKTLGIIGAGNIGTAVGLKAPAFNMHVLYTDINKNEILEKKVRAKKVNLNNLLSSADIITIHTPLTKETYKLIGEKEFSMMRRTAFLINTARGPIVDEKALISALKENKIAGAALDVYENEPYISDELKKLNNIILLPHIGSATKLTRERMANLAILNLITGLIGETPPNLVNPVK